MALKCITVKAGYQCQESLSELVSGEKDSSAQVVHALFLSGKAQYFFAHVLVRSGRHTHGDVTQLSILKAEKHQFNALIQLSC